VPIVGYLLREFAGGNLNPERPLMTVMVLLFLGGSMALGFALLSLQMVDIRRSLIRLRCDATLTRREQTDELAEYRRRRLAYTASTDYWGDESLGDYVPLENAVGAEAEPMRC
jgi:hypothetical protein